MNLLESIVYGIIQGLAEFLPISSSGHLAIFHAIFGGGGDNLAFDVLLHLGTLAAVLLVYRKDVGRLIVSFFTLCGKLLHGKFHLSDYDPGERFVIMVLVATIPLIPAALLDGAVAALSGYLWIVGAILLLNAVMLFFSDNFAKGSKGLEEATPKNALIVGLGQMFAVLPGLSRSGTTITVGLTQGYDRTFAVRFSFILSIPAILGACVLELPEFFSTALKSEEPSQLLIYIAGALTAAIVGVCAMKLLELIAKKSTFRIFSYYCAAAGLAAIGLYFLK